MAGKAQRRAAQEAVATYHAECLGELVRRVGAGVDEFRAGKIDAFDLDRILFQYSRAAKELWKFSSDSDVEFIATVIDRDEAIDWWARGTPRSR